MHRPMSSCVYESASVLVLASLQLVICIWSYAHASDYFPGVDVDVD